MKFQKPFLQSLALLILALALAATGPLSCSRGSQTAPTASENGTIYYCPMHPTQTSDRPGSCPICQMRLVPLEKPAARGVVPPRPGDAAPQAGPPSSAAAAARPSRRRTLYRSPMNSADVSDRPGKDSMGMERVPIEVEEEELSASPTGWSEIQIPPERLQRSGVTFGRVVTKHVVRTIHSVGRIAVDETLVHHIHTKFSGWIEHLYVDDVGKLVRRGDPLFTIYSPELVATQEEYVRALEARTKLGRSSDPEIASGAEALVEAARQRLHLWDINNEQIERLAETREIHRTLTIYSPSTGVVTEKNTNHGMYVEPSLRQLALADLSRVWILADVYENEISLVREGQQAEVRLSYFPGKAYLGRVSFVYPTIDPVTRTAKARIEVVNPVFELKPDMFADVDLKVDAGLRNIIPKGAVLQTGNRAIAFLDLGAGRLAPREIQLGLVFDDDLEVLSGLSPGDRVVTSANFLIDSESRLRAALMGAAPSATPRGSTPPGSEAPAGPGEGRP